MHVITVRFVVKEAKADQFRARVLQQARDSLSKEAGCRVFDVCTDPSAPGQFFLYEVYDTAGDFDAHLQSDHFKAFDAEVADWVESKHVETFLLLEEGIRAPGG
jgi:quinol monooxygenase YgiN